MLNNKTTPDTDENHYMAYDLLFETVFSQTLKENSTSQIEQLSKARKNEIEEIVVSSDLHFSLILENIEINNYRTF